MSKVEEEAIKRYPKIGLYDNLMKREGFIEGYHQAEKDLELSWEDIKEICDITFEEACRLQRNMKSSHIYKEQHYQEVLKRFKEKKER